MSNSEKNQTKFIDMKNLLEWYREVENQQVLASALLECSGNDKRKLKAKSFKDSDSVWGHLAKVVFVVNEEINRFFLYTVWKENRLNIQVNLNNFELCINTYLQFLFSFSKSNKVK